MANTLRTETLRHSGARAWKVFATSRSGRFASKVCTLAMNAPGMASRNSCAFCGVVPGRSRREPCTTQCKQFLGSHLSPPLFPVFFLLRVGEAIWRALYGCTYSGTKAARLGACRSPSTTSAPPPAHRRRAVVHTPCLRSRDPVAHRRRRRLPQVREPAVHRLVQGARRAEQAAAARREAERKRGVIAMSAGNHAQGVAYHAGAPRHPGHHRHAALHAQHQGRSTRAATAPRSCCDGDTLAEAGDACAARWPRASNLVFVHPYDDPRIIAGQGTVGARDARGRCPSSTRSWCRSAAAA